MKRLSILVVVFLAFLGVQSAQAWGTVGHLCAAYIAEQHLTPEAKSKCRHYLKHTLPYYAMWMDCWRGVKQYEAINNGHSIRTTDNGRKVNWEALPSSVGSSVTPTPPGRAMGHLLGAFNELRDGKYKNMPDSVVRQRLINMIHYVPDMHCPSHCGFPQHIYKSNTDYDIKRNGKKIPAFHGFWDGSPALKRKNLTLKKYADMVDHVSPKQVKEWQKGLEKRDVKAGLSSWGKGCIQRTHKAYALIPEGTDIAKLSKEQVAEVQALADLSILIGAYRLAYVLNTIFAE